jgi:hypothetical protein
MRSATLRLPPFCLTSANHSGSKPSTVAVAAASPTKPGSSPTALMSSSADARASGSVDRPREERTEIAVPAIVSEDTFARVGQRLADNKRFASRNSKVPSLLQGLAACSACG